MLNSNCYALIKMQQHELLHVIVLAGSKTTDSIPLM